MPRFLPAGDRALTIELGTSASLAQSQRVMALYAKITETRCPGVVEIVPALGALTIHYNPVLTSSARLIETFHAAAVMIATSPAFADSEDDLLATPPLRRWLLPACYGSACGPDVEAVASHCGLDPWQVSALHACLAYRVFMLGLLPGHPYMGDLPPPLQLPRRNSPRTKVPSGSIAIATTMSVIYPQESPGGWHIIARTPVRLFDPRRAEPSLLAPGDEVRFQPVSFAEFERLADDVADGWSPIPVPNSAPERDEAGT